jgi:hypothetical protein
MDRVVSVSTFMYENGNTGYHRLNITVKFANNSVYTLTLNTGLGHVENNLLLCNLDELLNGELTEVGYADYELLKSKPWWRDAVILHDQQVISDLQELVEDTKQLLMKYKTSN